jgi:small subunit ribosomal protein S3
VGQKTNPKGFRLVTTQKHLSEWYTNKKNYPTLLEEDFFIRSKVEEYFKDTLSLSKIEIHRITQDEKTKECVNIKIYALFPRAKEISRKISKLFSSSVKTSSETIVENKLFQNLPESKEFLASKNITGLLNLKENLKGLTAFVLKKSVRNFIKFLELKTKKNYYISFEFIKNPFQDPVLIAKFIADQLEKRTPFRRAVKQTIKKVQRTTLKGVKIQVSGRLNGIDIARSEWKRDGKIPLHTLKADIDYTQQIAQTIYGIIGIKVWLFLGNQDRNILLN